MVKDITRWKSSIAEDKKVTKPETKVETPTDETPKTNQKTLPL
jgi:hypothetical protein